MTEHRATTPSGNLCACTCMPMRVTDYNQLWLAIMYEYAAVSDVKPIPMSVVAVLYASPVSPRILHHAYAGPVSPDSLIVATPPDAANDQRPQKPAKIEGLTQHSARFMFNGDQLQGQFFSARSSNDRMKHGHNGVYELISQMKATIVVESGVLDGQAATPSSLVEIWFRSCYMPAQVGDALDELHGETVPSFTSRPPLFRSALPSTPVTTIGWW
ncbi:hypothetical protein GE09DRAFT_629197 [Coniochaeta sp. 2T2.1]|nr:hypothetical protein GE09DRAFT_629197 [Coniochaeta sp. 2T2.1]